MMEEEKQYQRHREIGEGVGVDPHGRTCSSSEPHAMRYSLMALENLKLASSSLACRMVVTHSSRSSAELAATT